MKKIIHFHFDTKNNIGDAAIVYAIQDLLKKEFKVKNVTSRSIYSLSNFEFGKFYINNLSNKNVIFKKLLNTKMVDYPLRLFRNIGGFLKYYYKNRYLINKINDHDLMIIGGGGVYSKWTLPLDTNLINKIKIPIVIFGAGYNHNYTDKMLSEIELNSIKALNTKASLCSVRDENTFNLVKKFNKESYIIGDPAIFLRSSKINLNFSKEKIKIGLNISCHEKHTRYRADEIVSMFLKFINKVREKTNIQLYYLKHSTDEEYVINKIKNEAPDIKVCDYSPREMKYVYENIDVVICMMLHSSIFAYGSDTKFINIAYDEKNFAFMKLINNTENLIDLRKFDVDTLYKKYTKLLKSNSYKEKVCRQGYFKDLRDNFIQRMKLLI